MQKNILLLSFLSMLLLAACNTTPNESVNEPEQPTNITANDENSELEKNNEADQNNEEVDETEQQEATNGEANGEASGKPNSITYTTKGNTLTESTINVGSTQQDYTIDLLEGYSLTSEEPGRDMVLKDENNAVSMRIETFNKADIVFEELLTQTKDSVLAIAPEEQSKELDMTNVDIGKQISNMHTFYVELGAETVSTLLYETNNKFIRLTIYDDESDLKYALLNMGLTIQ